MCLRCSRCCYFFIDGERHKCKFLRGKLCSIYNKKNRVGTVIYKEGETQIQCFNRDDCKENFKDCNYNQPGQIERDVGF